MNAWKQPSVTGTQSAAVDQGLRSYMLGIYNYMASGLALTGIVALLAASIEPLQQLLWGTPLQWVVMLAPLGFVMFLSFKIQTMSFKAAQMSFWAFATVMGLSMSYIFLVYTGASIARVFFITAGMFAGVSLWGYTTKKDLTGMGSFLIMGVWGIILASIVNLFLKSSALDFGLSVLSVLVFTGLTAYDTQRLKGMYYAMGAHGEMAMKMAIMGALSLYMDFINLFLNMLRLFGDRR